MNLKIGIHQNYIIFWHWKDGQNAAYEGKIGWKCVYFPPVGIFAFVVNMIKILFPICTLNWHVNNYVSRQGKGINRRNESALFIMNV